PHNVEALLEKITPTLRPDAQIVSFAAGYPLESICRITGRPAARGMADPWWNVSAVVRGNNFSNENFHRVFHGLTRNPTIELTTNKELDDFTFAISYAFVVLLRYPNMKYAEEHLEFIAPLIGIKIEELRSFLPKECSQRELISLAVTKGGISEAIMKTIQN